MKFLALVKIYQRSRLYVVTHIYHKHDAFPVILYLLMVAQKNNQYNLCAFQWNHKVLRLCVTWLLVPLGFFPVYLEPVMTEVLSLWIRVNTALATNVGKTHCISWWCFALQTQLREPPQCCSLSLKFHLTLGDKVIMIHSDFLSVENSLMLPFAVCAFKICFYTRKDKLIQKCHYKDVTTKHPEFVLQCSHLN